MNLNRPLTWQPLAVTVLAGAWVSVALAAQPAPPAQPPEPTAVPAAVPAPSPAATKPASPPSEPTLDELLGLPKSAPPARKPAEEAGGNQPQPADPAAGLDRAKAELDRLLSPKEVSEQFEQAVSLMDLAAKRLGPSRDVSIETQRIQEEILRKLDKLIDDAVKRSNQQQSQSSSSQNQQQKNQQEQQQQNQQSQSQQQQQSQSQQQSPGDGTGGSPSRQDGAGKPPPAGSAATWGNLPSHLRDALQQGSSDRFSARYRAQTEEYYKRLAEDRKATTRGGAR